MIQSKMLHKVEAELKSYFESESSLVSYIERNNLANALRAAAGLLGVLAATFGVWLISSGSGAFAQNAANTSAQYSAYKWSYYKTSDGIVVFTSDAPRHSFDAVLAEATLDARPETLIPVMRDFSAYPSWYARCIQTRVLARAAARLPIRLTPEGKFLPTGKEESYTIFVLYHVPIVADRWATVRNKARFGRDGSMVIEFHSLDQYNYHGPEGAVRARTIGYWILLPLSPTRTRVSLMLDTDPDLSYPAFLVNPYLRNIAIDTVAGLRKIVRSGSGLASN